MTQALTREEFKTREGRKRAMREFLVADHGVIRACYDNTHEVAPGVWRSFQPSPGALKSGRSAGSRPSSI